MPVSGNGFSFDWLYHNYIPQLVANNSSYIIHPYQNASAIALTYDGCVAGVGADALWYTRHDVYDRVLMWRVPLIALWATTTLPAFGWHTKLFTLMHLIADPIDTFWSLFYKLHLAQLNARWVRETDEDPRLYTTITPTYESEEIDDSQIGTPLGRRQTAIEDHDERERKLAIMLAKRDPDVLQYYRDVVASIITAYDEWGFGLEASKAVNYGL